MGARERLLKAAAAAALALLALTQAACAADVDEQWCSDDTDGVCAQISVSAGEDRLRWTAWNRHGSPTRMVVRVTADAIDDEIPDLVWFAPPSSTMVISHGAGRWVVRVLLSQSAANTTILEALFNTTAYAPADILNSLRVNYSHDPNAPPLNDDTICRADLDGLGHVCAAASPTAWSTIITVTQTYPFPVKAQVLFYDFPRTILTRFTSQTRPAVELGCPFVPTNVPYCTLPDATCCMNATLLGDTPLVFEAVAEDAPTGGAESVHISLAYSFGWANASRFEKPAKRFLAALPFDNTTVEVPVNAAISADNTVVFTLPEGAPVLAVFAGALIASVNDTQNLIGDYHTLRLQNTDGTVTVYSPVCNATVTSMGDAVALGAPVGFVCAGGTVDITLLEFSLPALAWTGDPFELPYSAPAPLPFFAEGCRFGATWNVNTTLRNVTAELLKGHCRADPLALPPPPTDPPPLIDLGQDGAMFAGVLVAGTIAIMLALMYGVHRYRKRVREHDRENELSASVSVALNDVEGFAAARAEARAVEERKEAAAAQKARWEGAGAAEGARGKRESTSSCSSHSSCASTSSGRDGGGGSASAKVEQTAVSKTEPKTEPKTGQEM